MDQSIIPVAALPNMQPDTRDALYDRLDVSSIATVALACAKSGLTLDQCGPSGGPARAAFEAAFNVFEGANHAV